MFFLKNAQQKNACHLADREADTEVARGLNADVYSRPTSAGTWPTSPLPIVSPLPPYSCYTTQCFPLLPYL